MKDIVRLLQDEPGVLVGATFKVGGYRAELIDAWAAGTAFYQVQFKEGPHNGLSPWLTLEDEWLRYDENVNSDGFGFNWRTPAPDTVDVIDGDLLPVASGYRLAITA